MAPGLFLLLQKKAVMAGLPLLGLDEQNVMACNSSKELLQKAEREDRNLHSLKA